MNANRYSPAIDSPLRVSPDWNLDCALPASSMFGANGLRFGADGELYVAQAFGSQISRVDPKSGIVTTVAPVGGSIVAPDDLAFDADGTLYATEVFSGRVSARTVAGEVRVISDQVPVANGITMHRGRLFVDEFRVDGRVLELFRDGRPPRVIAENLLLPNALCAGPDDFLYFPLVVTGEVGRVPIDGGPVEIFASGLNLPTAVKIDSRGRLFVVESGSGSISSFDIPSRLATRRARVRPGIDNLAFSESGELYVSNFSDGGISRIGEDGAESVLIARGLLGPYGLAVDVQGAVYIADGMSYARVGAGGVERPAMLLNHGFPGYVRGIAVARDGTLFLSNSAGGVASFVPGSEAVFLATDLDQVMGIAMAADGRVLVCEAGAGRIVSLAKGESPRVIASGLKGPTGLAVDADGACFVAEAAAGRIVKIENGTASTVLEGLVEPHGVALAGGSLYALDRGGKSLHCVSLHSHRSTVVAAGLPVGPSPGCVPHVLPGIPGVMPGPLSPFADLAAAHDGSVFLSADGDGSLLRITPKTRGA